MSLRSGIIETFLLKIIGNTKESLSVVCAHKGQKSALDSLQLQTVVHHLMWVLGTELGLLKELHAPFNS